MRIFILLSLISLFTESCGGQKIKEEVNKKIAEAPKVKSEQELYSIENNLLSKSSKLTDIQKNKLSLLIEKMKNQNASIENEINKTKAVLFQTLVNDDNSKAKLNILESKLIKLNRKKTRYSLNAYREARNIMGKNNLPLEQTLQMIDNRSINSL